MTDSDAGGDLTSPSDAPVKADPQRPRRLSFFSGRMGAAVTGFVCGAIAWHLVGFWGFVAHAVFSGPRAQVAYQPVAPQAARARGDAGAAETSPSAPKADNTHILMRTRSGRAYQPTSHNQFSKAGATPTGVPATVCTTLLQEAPGGQIRQVPCPVNTVEPLDLDRELAIGTATRGERMGNQGVNAGVRPVETGSLPARDGGFDSSADAGPGDTSGWATSLQVSQ